MNNQEAISVLESIDAKTDYFLINDDDRAEALDMAISALQAQDVPDTNVGDMVSRRGAIEAVSNWLYDGDDRRSVDQLLSALPSAQPEIIRCKGCKHKHLENAVWTCPFGLPGGPDFYCGYGAERRADE